MGDSLEVAKNILELEDTVQEGLDHLAKRMGEGHLEDTVYLFQDIGKALGSIIRAIQPLIAELGENELEELETKLSLAFEEMSHAYEDGKLDKARMDMQFVLSPTFSKWKAEVERCLRPLLES